MSVSGNQWTLGIAAVVLVTASICGASLHHMVMPMASLACGAAFFTTVLPQQIEQRGLLAGLALTLILAAAYAVLAVLLGADEARLPRSLLRNRSPGRFRKLPSVLIELLRTGILHPRVFDSAAVRA